MPQTSRMKFTAGTAKAAILKAESLDEGLLALVSELGAMACSALVSSARGAFRVDTSLATWLCDLALSNSACRSIIFVSRLEISCFSSAIWFLREGIVASMFDFSFSNCCLSDAILLLYCCCIFFSLIVG